MGQNFLFDRENAFIFTSTKISLWVLVVTLISLPLMFILILPIRDPMGFLYLGLVLVIYGSGFAVAVIVWRQRITFDLVKRELRIGKRFAPNRILPFTEFSELLVIQSQKTRGGRYGPTQYETTDVVLVGRHSGIRSSEPRSLVPIGRTLMLGEKSPPDVVILAKEATRKWDKDEVEKIGSAIGLPIIEVDLRHQ